MKEQHILNISKELALQEQHVRNTLELTTDGTTVPFISRYRKPRRGTEIVTFRIYSYIHIPFLNN